MGELERLLVQPGRGDLWERHFPGKPERDRLLLALFAYARQLLRELAARREKLALSQTVVAARMGTSQSAVDRLEAVEIDAKLSTVERFAAALGQKVEWRVAKARKSAAASS